MGRYLGQAGAQAEGWARLAAWAPAPRDCPHRAHCRCSSSTTVDCPNLLRKAAPRSGKPSTCCAQQRARAGGGGGGAPGAERQRRMVAAVHASDQAPPLHCCTPAAAPPAPPGQNGITTLRSAGQSPGPKSSTATVKRQPTSSASSMPPGGLPGFRAAVGAASDPNSRGANAIAAGLQRRLRARGAGRGGHRWWVRSETGGAERATSAAACARSWHAAGACPRPRAPSSRGRTNNKDHTAGLLQARAASLGYHYAQLHAASELALWGRRASAAAAAATACLAAGLVALQPLHHGAQALHHRR